MILQSDFKPVRYTLVSISCLCVFYTGIVKGIRDSGIPAFLIFTKCAIITILELEISVGRDNIPNSPCLLFNRIPSFVYLFYIHEDLRQVVELKC